MRQKDFELIASVLVQVHRRRFGIYWKTVVLSFADRLEATHPKFDRYKFLVLCGYQP